MRRFENRKDAGRRLAAALHVYADRDDVLVLALPRGGVPVANEVARELRVPLDIWLVRKLGVPGHAEYAMGAIALGDQQYVDERLVARLGIPKDEFAGVLARETEELERRNQQYRGGRPLPQLDGLTVILIDDGLATGASMRVAIQSVRNAEAQKIIVAVPVAPPEVCRELAEFADRVVCLEQPEPFHGVGQWYDDFAQTDDSEVLNVLAMQASVMPERPYVRP